jgi:sulfonate transport system substrate-binding protein
VKFPRWMAAALTVALAGLVLVPVSGAQAYGAQKSEIPKGVVLRVGDQQENLQTLFSASGALAGAPYQVQFDQFASGPLVDQAFAAHVIDVGTMGDTPASGTVSGKLGLSTVAVSKWDGPIMVLLARPGIKTVAQLKGKNVAYTTGTAEQAFALRALASAHLKQAQVDQVNVALNELGTVLETGSADASTVTAPDEIQYKQTHPGATVLAASDTVSPPLYDYVLASPSTLANSGKSAATFDFVRRLINAENWVKAHPNQWVQDYYVNVDHITPSLAKSLLSTSGEVTYVPITPPVQTALQQMVDLMANAGAIPASFSVKPLYNPKATAAYNAIVKETPQP